MRDDVVQRLGYNALAKVKSNPSFPYRTGNLRNNATKVDFVVKNQFSIVFDKRVAPYIDFLQRHKKHKGFIDERAVDDVVKSLRESFHTPSRYAVVSSTGRSFVHK
jgi:hypothetical protein